MMGWVSLLLVLLAAGMIAVASSLLRGRAVPFGLLGTVLVLGTFLGVLGAIQNWAYFTSPIPPPLTEPDRAEVLKIALKRTGVAALTATGDMITLRDDAVAHISGSRCTTHQQCVDSRGSSIRQTCRKVKAHFECAYEVFDRDAKPAVVYLRAYENEFFSPRREYEQVDLWRHSPIHADQPDLLEAKAKLCALDYCKPGAMKSFWRPVAAATPDAGIEGGGRCRGIDTVIAGKGRVCLQPDVPAAREFRDCKGSLCGPVMVALPQGRYLRGTSDVEARHLAGHPRDMPHWLEAEQPQQEVVIAYHIAIGKLEVTFEEWDACVIAGGCSRLRQPEDAGWGRGKRPVMSVAWTDIAREFLPWLNTKLGIAGDSAYRLPSDAEWEFAARAGTTTRYAFGDTLTPADARYLDAAAGGAADRTVEAGTYKPNAFGLHDMHGNVAEWVRDCDGPPSRWNRPTDGSAFLSRDCSLRIVRGGDWRSAPVHARSASRIDVDQNTRDIAIGFRVARTLQPAR